MRSAAFQFLGRARSLPLRGQNAKGRAQGLCVSASQMRTARKTRAQESAGSSVYVFVIRFSCPRCGAMSRSGYIAISWHSIAPYKPSLQRSSVHLDMRPGAGALRFVGRCSHVVGFLLQGHDGLSLQGHQCSTLLEYAAVKFF